VSLKHYYLNIAIRKGAREIKKSESVEIGKGVITDTMLNFLNLL
jgi:hypothetical protein